MRNTAFRNGCTLLLGIALCACRTTPTVPRAQPPSLIPAPVSLELQPGSFELRGASALAIRCSGEETAAVAERLDDWMRRSGAPGAHCAGAGEAAAARVEFRLDRGFAAGGDHADEAYDLQVTPERVTLSARTAHGLFNGATTLWQLLAAPAPAGAPLRVPALHVVDYPRFGWRGLLLDSARHYQTPASIERLIDAMALHKLDVLHWHLSDDQGWRIEIRRYPLLTAIGAWRAPQPNETALADPATGKYGGYYTQEQVRAIVAYAAARHVTIVPEIDMPGHAQAAIAAYPQLGVDGSRPAVSSDWGINTYILNVEESTFSFVDDVLAEIVELFPSPYIHVGGDEAAKDRWQASARVHARMRQLGIADEEALQGYFTARLDAMLRARGRRLIGWDEILESGLPAGATVMSWRGRDGAIAAAQHGDDVVMTPDPAMYFDHLQSRAPDEPPGRVKPLTLADVYAFDAVPPELDAAQARHVLGGQGNLWSEYLTTDERLEHAAFPRAAALAEALWTPRERRSWKDFVARLPAQFARYRAQGTRFSDGAFEPVFALRRASAGSDIAVAIGKQEPFGTLRYTLDGSEPTPASPEYAGELRVRPPATVRAATFAGDRTLAQARTQAVDEHALLRRASAALRPCTDSLLLRLEGAPDGAAHAPLYNVDLMNPCWIYPQLDFGRTRRIDVRIGALPYFFQLWHDAAKVVSYAPSGAGAELQLRLDSCSAAPIATLPLGESREARTVRVPVNANGLHDLCVVFAARGRDPLWLIDWIEPASE